MGRMERQILDTMSLGPRGFGNDNWFHLFPWSHMSYLDMSSSDHRPVLVCFVVDTTKSDSRKFCFDNRWATKPSVHEAIERGGKGLTVVESNLISDGIRRCRQELAVCKKSANVNSGFNIEVLKEALEK